MRQIEITKPVGLKEVCKEIEDTCRDYLLYKRAGLHPSHLILPLDSGSGRTTIVQYMADMYKKNKVMDFRCSLDDFLEIVFDGSPKQLCQEFARIDASADYANEYRNIVAMDVSSIAHHPGEIQYDDFLEKSCELCKNACVLFFTGSIPDRDEENLIEDLLKQIDNIKLMSIEPYSKEELAQIAARDLKDRDIEILNEHEFNTALLDIIDLSEITTVKETLKLVENLIRYADFSSFTPLIDGIVIKDKVADLTQTGRSDTL